MWTDTDGARHAHTPVNDKGSVIMTMRSAPFAGTLVALACVALAGCGANKMSADTSVPSDARIRHPIALTDAPYSTDVFPSGGSGALDRRTADQISDFAERYRTIGHGPITVLVPTGGANDAAMSHSVTAMRHALAQSARAPVSVVPYPVADPALAAPVRLSFEGLKAKVSHRCGDWPSDLASGSTTRGWDNKTYWNFGCANQNMLAAQVLIRAISPGRAGRRHPM